MADYISREAVLETLKRECSPKVFAYLADQVNAIPAADVRPVVKARWNVGADGWECSNCAIESNNTYPICPYCGADMREES